MTSAAGRGKGDVAAQRQRRANRYRGCKVCGVRGIEGGCQECPKVKAIVEQIGVAHLSLIVDGSYTRPDGHAWGETGGDRYPVHFAGAGLVLVRGDLLAHKRVGDVLASRACGFLSDSSSDAELQAVIRGARWVPGVTIWTDSAGTLRELEKCGLTKPHGHLTANYIPQRLRRIAAFQLAHRLSVEGRCRDNPEDDGHAVANAIRREGKSDRQRRMMGAEILLEHAEKDPAFDGDFVALAEKLGWTSGTFWRTNPNIAVAAKRWSERNGDPK